MKFEVKQAAQLELIMDKLGTLLEKKELNDPLMVGLAKAYALCALAYAQGDFRKPEI